MTDKVLKPAESKTHRWHLNMPDAVLWNNGEFYLTSNSERIELPPLTAISISITGNGPNKIVLEAIPREMEAVIRFTEENPGVIKIVWPTCPHCGMLLNDQSKWDMGWVKHKRRCRMQDGLARIFGKTLIKKLFPIMLRALP